MENNKLINVEQAKQMDMVQFLASLGHRPKNVRGTDHWYQSPLREEKSPSFKVNSALNRWFDFGQGKGGNLVDFGVLYFKCSVRELLEKLSSDFSFPQQSFPPRPVANHDQSGQKKIVILSEKELASIGLTAYLDQRKIRPEFARRYCREITYSYGERTYYGIGFKNNSGGFEIRSKYAKLSSSPKDITLIKSGSDKLSVFEGFTDFLSYLSMDQKAVDKASDYLILNSTSFFEKSIDLMNTYQTKWLYLDNDATGHKCRGRVLALNDGYEDKSILYEGYKDLNEWLVKRDPPQRQKMHRGL